MGYRGLRWLRCVSLAAAVFNSPSAPRYSRTLERRTASPSACRENGVLPAPLTCISWRPPSSLVVSSSEMARPSPNWPAH